MEIKERYLQKYLHDIAVDQLIDDYKKKGYSVLPNERINDYVPDLVLRNDQETIIIEVKAGRMTKEKREAVAKVGKYVKDKSNYKFLVVIATPPKEKNLDIQNLKSLLETLIATSYSDEINIPSAKSELDEIVNVDVDEIIIEGEDILAKGNGVVAIELNYGHENASDPGEFRTEENFPFSFDVILGYNNSGTLEIKKVNDLSVDTSSFFD